MYAVNNLTIDYAQRRVLDIPALRIAPDEVTVLLGHNGSGKSTLLSTLAMPHRRQSAVTLNGQPLNRYSQGALAREVAYLPQHIGPAPGLTVSELVLLGRFAWRGNYHRWTQDDYAITEQAIARVGLIDFKNTLVDDMSGGERQRAWLAMMLAQKAKLFLLDEPVSALDIPYQHSVLQLLRDLCDTTSTGMLIVLHDVNLAATFADRVIALKGGVIIFDGTPDALMTPKHLSDIYGMQASVLPHPRTSQPIAVF